MNVTIKFETPSMTQSTEIYFHNTVDSLEMSLIVHKIIQA